MVAVKTSVENGIDPYRLCCRIMRCFSRGGAKKLETDKIKCHFTTKAYKQLQ